MCAFKKPKVPTEPERQAMQVPEQLAGTLNGGLMARRRRGLWSSIMTSPRGIPGAPTVTGTAPNALG